MTLLREIMERPREAAYAEATERRRDDGARRSWVQEIIVLLLTIAIGTGGVWAARQLRAPVDSALEARAVLEEQIQDRTAVGEALREDVDVLRSQISDLEGQFSTPADEARAIEAENARQHAGTIAVFGPGIEVELTESSQPSSPEENVMDVDIQIVVNSLWASGAEAIAINDRRLAYGTAIRTAGEVILVDLEPVQSPYSVTAIGDPDRLLRSFSQTPGAEHLKSLHANYRIGSGVVQLARIDMDAGNAIRITHAEPGLADAMRGTLGEGRDEL